MDVAHLQKERMEGFRSHRIAVQAGWQAGRLGRGHAMQEGLGEEPLLWPCSEDLRMQQLCPGTDTSGDQAGRGKWQEFGQTGVP